MIKKKGIKNVGLFFLNPPSLSETKKKKMAGQPTVEQTKQFGQRMKNARTRPYAWDGFAMGADEVETKMLNSNLYPMKPLPEDKFDTEWNIRQQLVTAPGAMITNARPMPWTEGEIDYLKRKRDAEEYAAYNSWLGERFPLNDPANRELLKRIVPRYFEVRKSNLQEAIALQAQYANLRLFGPESEEDLKLEYEVETGRKKIPLGPFHDPVKWLMNEQGLTDAATNTDLENAVYDQNDNAYAKGLFNPFGFLLRQNGPFALNPFNKADIRGDNRYRVRGPLGAAGPLTNNYLSNYGGAYLGQTERNRTGAQRLEQATIQQYNQVAINRAANNTAVLSGVPELDAAFNPDLPAGPANQPFLIPGAPNLGAPGGVNAARAQIPGGIYRGY